MTDDIHNWDPMPVEQVAELMSDIDVPWWIVGGWAIDLFLRRQTRSHGDTDILIRREDQLEVRDYLADKGLLLYKTQQPGLKPWLPGEYQAPPFDDIWCRWTNDTPWVLQLMLQCTEKNQWVFKRDVSIKGSLDTLGRRTSSGVPYMAPHIQLLYKAKPQTLEKDQSDFDLAVTHIPRQDQVWLLQHLQKRFKEGHPWIDHLEELVAQPGN